MYATERQRRILARLERAGRVVVTAVAEDLGVTQETIRRDLGKLESLGRLRRVHGGAVPPAPLRAGELTMDERRTLHEAEKQRIAARALELLHEEQPGSVIIDAGSTTGAMADALAELPRRRSAERLVVITNAPELAARIYRNPAIEVALLPGRLRSTTGACVGPQTIAALDELRADLVLLGANGLDAEFGGSTPDVHEAAVKTAMVRSGARMAMVADGSKLGRIAVHRFAKLDRIDVLITDLEPDRRLASALDDAGTEVRLA